MSETGVVKFHAECVAREIAAFAEIDQLNRYRAKLGELGWIGVDPNGIGFGNMSVRDGTSFFITGSGTGHRLQLTINDWARVISSDFARNAVTYEGAATPSSESLTHAAVYEADADAHAVIHCHSATLWNQLIDRTPTTSREVEYGTPEMAREVMRLFATTEVKQKRIFVMAGHPDGIIAFGPSVADAFAVLRS